MSFRVCHLMSCCIWKLLGFREFISPWIDLSCTLYLGGVFILCWHHKDNKLLSIYRNIKSQDGFALCNEPIGEIVCLKNRWDICCLFLYAVLHVACTICCTKINRLGRARRKCFKPNLDDCLLGKVNAPLYSNYFDKPIFCNKSAGTAFLFTMKSIVLRAT